MVNKGRNLGFFLLQGLYWASYCVLFGYTVTIFSAYGYSAQMCGVITTLQYLVPMAVQPLYGYLIDNVISPKWFCVGMMAASGGCALLLPYMFTQSAPVIIGYFLFLSLFLFCGSGVVDTWCISVINASRGMDFGLVRSGGSIFYALTGLVAGNIIAPLGITALFYIHGGLAFLGAVVALLLPDPRRLPRPEQLEAPARVSFADAIKVLIKCRPYVTYVVCMCCYYFASRATQIYMPIILKSVGGGDGHYGISMFLSSGGEMIVMLLVSRLIIRGVRLEKLFGVALGLFTVRYILLAAVQNLWVILAGQLLLAVGFGLQVRVHTQYITKMIPEGYQGTAILLCSSIGSGGAAMLGNLFGGEMLDRVGIQPYLVCCAGMMLLAGLIFLPTLAKIRRQEQDMLASFLLQQLEEEQP